LQEFERADSTDNASNRERENLLPALELNNASNVETAKVPTVHEINAADSDEKSESCKSLLGEKETDIHQLKEKGAIVTS